MNTEQKRIVDEWTKRLTDEGKIIEAGWMAMKILAIPKGYTDEQIAELRQAYFMGAQHLFASIMGILDPGEEPTEDDMRRMSLIAEELESFSRDAMLAMGPVGGRG